MYSCKNLLAHFQECNSDVGTATDVHIRAQLGGISYMQPREDRIYFFFIIFTQFLKCEDTDFTIHLPPALSSKSLLLSLIIGKDTSSKVVDAYTARVFF